MFQAKVNGYAEVEGRDGKKGREREPVIISFTTLFLPLLARLTEIIRFWQEPIN